MQRVDLKFYDGPLHCPFCGKKTIGGGKMATCKHTLFVAVDERLEYYSDKMDGKALEKRAERTYWDRATEQVQLSRIGEVRDL